MFLFEEIIVRGWELRSPRTILSSSRNKVAVGELVSVLHFMVKLNRLQEFHVLTLAHWDSKYFMNELLHGGMLPLTGYLHTHHVCIQWFNFTDVTFR